jgi:hypothetical protein
MLPYILGGKMAECPFCFTALDDRATVCRSCGARKGFGIDSDGNVMGRSDMSAAKFKISAVFAVLGIAVFLFILVAVFDKHMTIAGAHVKTNTGDLMKAGALGAVFLLISFLFSKIKKREKWYR